jgi:hypothetical protein
VYAFSLLAAKPDDTGFGTGNKTESFMIDKKSSKRHARDLGA